MSLWRKDLPRATSALLAGALLSSGVGALAQVEPGSIEGRVRDETGAPLAGVRIAVRNTATGGGGSAVSSGSGGYRFPTLAPGLYDVTAESVGFATEFHKGVSVSPAAPTPLDFTMKLLTVEQLMNIPVVTASKYSQTAGDAPATVVVVTEDQIRRRNYRSLLDLFRDLPDFKVDYRSDPEWYNSFTVRGIPGHDKFVVLMDGARVSGPTNELLPILENTPIHHARQVEIVYGPASALYGAGAMSGVINIITRHPENGGEATVDLGEDSLRLGRFLWGAKLGKVQLTLAGQWFHDAQPRLDGHFSDYRGFQAQRTNSFPTIFGTLIASDPYDREPSQASRTNAVYASLRVEGFSLSVFHNGTKLSSSNVYTPDNAIYNDDTFLGHRLTVANANHAKQFREVRLESSLTAARYNMDPNSSFRNVFSGLRRGYKYAASDAFTVEQLGTWTPTPRFTLTGGASYEAYHALPWSTDLNDPVDTRKAIEGFILGTSIKADFFPLNYSNRGAYLQGRFGITETVTVTAGARYDDNTRYGSTFNPRLGVVWHLGNAGTLKTLYGSAFLAPSPYAAYAHFGSFVSNDGGRTFSSSFWRLPNPDLKPIKSRTFEVSYRLALAESLSVTLLGYLTHLRNLFTLAPDGVYTDLYGGTYKGWPVEFIQVRTNLGKQRNYGGTVKVDSLHTFGPGRRLASFAAYSVVDGRVDPLENGVEMEIGGVTPSLLHLGSELLWDRWSLGARLTVAGRQRLEAIDPARNERYTVDGYGLLNLALRYRALNKFDKEMSLFATASNALDARYRNANENASGPSGAAFFGTPQDGRRLAFGVEARF